MKTKKISIIITSVLVVYAIIGFIILPMVLKSQLEKELNNQLIKKTTIESIEFNPFLLKLAVNGFKIADEKEEVISFKRLYIDFSLLKSIHETHISFKEIKLIEPLVNIIQKENGSFNLLELVKKSEKEEVVVKQEKKETKPVQFKITKTILDNANIKFTPYSKEGSSPIDINELNYTFYEIGTYKNSLASHSLNTNINKNTKLFVDGGFNLIPFKMYGKVKIENFKPKEYFHLAKEMVNFDISDANLDINLGYKLDTSKELMLEINDANLVISDFDILQKDKKLLGFKDFNINNLNVLYPQQSVNINDISFNTVYANVIKTKNDINLNTLVKASKDKKQEKPTNTEAKPWVIGLNTFNINNSRVNFKDTLAKLDVEVKPFNFKVDNLNVNDKDIKVKNVNLKNSGIVINERKSKLDIKTGSTQVNITDISYVDSAVSLNDIKLNNKSISLKQKEIKLNTTDISLLINDLKYIDNKLSIKNSKIKQKATSLIQNELDVQTKNIEVLINGLKYANNSLAIKNSQMNHPYVKVLINKKPKVDKKEEKATKKVEKKKASKEKASSLKLNIGPSNIKNAKLIFEDKNLPIPFKTEVSKLNGKFSELNSNSSRPTKLDLEGKVDKYGYTNITGFLEHKDIKELTDINLIFKNIAIKNFTPYSGKFVGRELKSGKLNLDLKYNIKKSNLAAQNSVIITDIELGDKIESPDAMSLPLELGIALLEDSDGVIDLNVPISGNLDDPQFSIAPIVWKVFTNLIIKAVTSPFSFLASLLGLEGDELKSAQFNAGSFEVLPFTQEKLDHLVKAMGKRPNIALSFAPTYDKNLDTYALSQAKVEAFIDKAMNKQKSKEEDIYLEILEDSFENLYKKLDLDDIKEKFEKVDKDKKEYFDKDGYLLHIKDMIVKKQVITPIELESMAKQRASSILNYFTGKKIDAKRIVVLEEIKTLEVKNKKDVDVEFKIDIKK